MLSRILRRLSVNVPQPVDGSGIEWLKWALAVIGAGALWAWKFVTGNISDLKKTTVSREEFRTEMSHVTDDMAAAAKQRDELRTSVIDLYRGQTELREDISRKHIELLEAIHRIDRKS